MKQNIEMAKIAWAEDGSPRSCIFDDIYFSSHEPLQETQYVFLESNRLPERFAATTQNFCIVETGFGSGINFLATWALWEEKQPLDSKATLHFISCEKHPLSLQDITRIHALFPALQPYAEALQAAYPYATPDIHRVILAGGRVQLTLYLGDIEAMPSALSLPSGVDAWFLDGFAPKKNPQMWQDTLYNWMYQVSVEGATIATFTAAGAVRRGLQAVGFEVSKVKGHGYKPEMIVAHKPVPSALHVFSVSEPKHAVVIGGGIAGCSAAYALAQAGIRVTLLEKQEAIASQASGNRAGVLFPLMNKTWTPQMCFYAGAYRYVQHLLRRLDAVGYARTGMVQIAPIDDEKTAARYHIIPQSLQLDPRLAYVASAADLSDKAGVVLLRDGLFYPDGTWVHVPSFCQALVNHPHITVQTQIAATSITSQSSSMQVQWKIRALHDKTEELEILDADIVVVANAVDAVRLLPDVKLPLYTMRGQVSHVAATEASKPLRAIVCYGGYISPAVDGVHSVGATYDRQRVDCTVDDAGHAHNITECASNISSLGFTPIDASHIVGGRAALRTMSRDRLPIFGEVAGCDGLYLSIAHGSRGLLSAPLAGEVIAALCTQQPLPISQSVLKTFSVLRYRFC